MFSEKLEELISLALSKGEVTEKEREIILRRAEKEGEDIDEVNMVLDARISLLGKKDSTVENPSMDSKGDALSVQSLPYWKKRMEYYCYYDFDAKRICDVEIEDSTKDLFTIILMEKGLMEGDEIKSIDFSSLHEENGTLCNDNIILANDYLKINNCWYVEKEVAEEKRFSDEVDTPVEEDLTNLPYFDQEIYPSLNFGEGINYSRMKCKLTHEGFYYQPDTDKQEFRKIETTKCIKKRGKWIVSNNFFFTRKRSIKIRGLEFQIMSDKVLISLIHNLSGIKIWDKDMDVIFIKKNQYLFDTNLRFKDDGIYTADHRLMEWHPVVYNHQIKKGESNIAVFHRDEQYFTAQKPSFTVYDKGILLNHIENHDMTLGIICESRELNGSIRRRFVDPSVLEEYLNSDFSEPIENFINRSKTKTESTENVVAKPATTVDVSNNEENPSGERLAYAVIIMLAILVLSIIYVIFQYYIKYG